MKSFAKQTKKHPSVLLEYIILVLPSRVMNEEQRVILQSDKTKHMRTVKELMSLLQGKALT